MYILDIFYERSNSLPSKIKREHTVAPGFRGHLWENDKLAT